METYAQRIRFKSKCETLQLEGEGAISTATECRKEVFSAVLAFGAVAEFSQLGEFE